MLQQDKKWLEKARKKALHKQKLMQVVVQRGLGGYHKASAASEQMVDTRRGPVRVLEYGFDDPRTLPLFVDLHGGGFIMMQADVDEPMVLQFRQAAPVKVISVDYPKAPQSPYPAAVEAVHDVVQHYVSRAAQYGIDTARMGIGGHSAGGNLATVTCLRDLQAREFGFAYQILDYPALDVATDPYAKPQPKGCIKPEEAAMYNACYVTPERAAELSASPALAGPEDVRGMPPALILVCGGDSLHDEAVRYANTLRAAGVEVRLQEYPHQPHGFTYFKPNDDSRDAIARMGAYMREKSGTLN